MIWLLSPQLWALECYLPSDVIEGGSIEKGFSSLFYEDVQERTHWNDNILRMTVLIEGADEEPLSVRWQSSLSGILQESDSTHHMQLWATNLRTGIHDISVQVSDKNGNTCSASISIKVSIPSLRCQFVEESEIGVGLQRELVDEVIDITPQEAINPFPYERVLYPYIQGRKDQDTEVWVEENGSRYPISIGRYGGGKIILPPRAGDHTLDLVVESAYGRRCTSQILMYKPELISGTTENHITSLGPEGMFGASFGLSHHSGWGGKGILSPAFDLVFAGRVSDGGFFLGGDLAIDFREAYREYLLKVQVGVLNGFALGPVMFLTGGGLGMDEYSQIDTDLTETRLYPNNHLFGYWRSEIFLWFKPEFSISGGFIPRWHWDDTIVSEDIWDSYSWNLTMRYASLTFGYEQHRVQENTIHSLMLGMGGNIFE